MTDNIAGGPMLVSEIAGHTNRINAEPYVFVQPKLRGWCGMANTLTRKIYTRSGAEITNMPHINAALPVDGPEWLHGEYYIHGKELDGVDQGLIKRGDPSVEFHVFDCVSDEGFEKRNDIIMEIWDNDTIKKVPTLVTGENKYIIEMYERCLSQGYEGIIIRLDGHGYEHGRSLNVFKMKPGTEVI